MAKSAQQIAQNWASKMQGAGPAYTAGIQSVQQSPGAAAAAAQSSYLAGVQNAANKWSQNVGAVTLQQWQQAAVQKGAPRLATGAQASQNKVANFHASLQPFQQNLKASLPAKGPKGTNGARMMAWMQGMMQFKKPAGS